MTAKKKLKDLMSRRQVGQSTMGKDRNEVCVADEEAQGDWEDGTDEQSEDEDQNADDDVEAEEQEHIDLQRSATAKSRLQELLRRKREQALAEEEVAGSGLEANNDDEKHGSIGTARPQLCSPGGTLAPKSASSAARPVVPDSDSDDDDDEEEVTTFSSLLHNLRKQIRGAATDKPPKEKEEEAEAVRLQDTVAGAVAAARQETARRTTTAGGLEVGEVDRERKAAAQRTLELLEARRLGDLAADNAGRKTGKRRNNTDKRCERDFTRSRLDEELAAQERGPRYVNNQAVFLKKGEKVVDTRKLKTNAVEKIDGSLDMTVQKLKTREERLTEIQQGLR